MTTTLYVLEHARFQSGDHSGSLLAPDGEPIYSHMSSSLSWLEVDLTRNFGRDAELAARYPDGYEVKVISLDDPVPDELAPFLTTGENEQDEQPAAAADG